mgnify:FL=1
MNNPICAAFGWPVPSDREVLHIAYNGHELAILTSATGNYYEAAYNAREAYGHPNPACSIVGRPPATQIIGQFKQRFRVKDVSKLTVTIGPRK